MNIYYFFFIFSKPKSHCTKSHLGNLLIFMAMFGYQKTVFKFHFGNHNFIAID